MCKNKVLKAYGKGKKTYFCLDNLYNKKEEISLAYTMWQWTPATPGMSKVKILLKGMAIKKVKSWVVIMLVNDVKLEKILSKYTYFLFGL